jgi:hypothetical protein
MRTVTSTGTFHISALPLAQFQPLFALSDAELAARGMRRVVADEHPGFPCRVSLEDAQPGESLILLHHVHHDVDGPYRGSGPIYVRERATPANLAPGEVPDLLRRRLLSLRAYDAAGMLRASEVIEGRELAALVAGMLADPDVAYLHAHNARPGCYNCRIDRSAG